MQGGQAWAAVTWEVLKVSDLTWVILSIGLRGQQSVGQENRVFLRQLWGEDDASSFSTSAKFSGALQDASLYLKYFY